LNLARQVGVAGCLGEDVDRASDWLDAEPAKLLATAGDGPTYTCQLARILDRHLRTTARHPEAFALHTQALSAARRTGDRGAEAAALARSRPVAEFWHPTGRAQPGRRRVHGLGSGASPGHRGRDNRLGPAPGFASGRAVRGELLARLGRRVERRAELELAARLCANQRERSVLLRKAATLG